MTLLDALGLKAPRRGAVGPPGDGLAGQPGEMRPSRIAADEPPATPVGETAMPAPPRDEPSANPGPAAGGDGESAKLQERAGDDPDPMSDADRKAALRRWKSLGAVDGDIEALGKALGDKKDKGAQAKARAEVKRLHGEILKGQKPAVLDVRPPPAQAHAHGDDARKPRRDDAGDAAPKGDAPMSEANKKKLSQAVKGSKVGLSDIETKDFGRWLISTHDEADFHTHLLTPASTRAKVLDWMNQEGWKVHKNEEKRNKFKAVEQSVHGDQATGTRTSRAERQKGGQQGGTEGEHGGVTGSGAGRIPDGDTAKGRRGGDADPGKQGRKGTPADQEVGKSSGGSGSQPRKGGSNADLGAKGGEAGKGSGTKPDAGDAKGGAATRSRQGAGGEHDGKGPSAKGSGSGTGSRARADAGAAAKFTDAALKGAGNKFNGMLRDSRAKLNELAKTDPAAREIVDALDKVDLLQDAESFAKNPKGFTATQAKNALIDAPFAHFGGVLEKSITEFDAGYPDVATLHHEVLLGGANLGQLRQQYEKAMGQLRVPGARAALIKVFLTIDVNDKTPPAEVKARLKLADEAIAKAPGLKAYVDAYYVAYDGYAFALGIASNRLTDLEESYAKGVSQLAAGLRVRAAALNRISMNLKGVADWIMDSPFIFFPMGEAAWFDFDMLSSRFGAFGNRLDAFANAVDARKTDYPAELKRLEAAGKAMGKSLLSLL